MHRTIYPTLCCVCALFFVVPATATQEVSKTEVLPLFSVAAEKLSTDWKQANQRVAELGGWQFYANEAADHKGMDHSRHSMPMDHSSHTKAVDHSKHYMPMDHSSHGKAVDHSKHYMPMDHSSHGKAVDHSRHAMPIDHASHTKAVDHSKHSMPMDHSSHGKAMDHSKHSMPMDHSKHLAPQPAKKGDEHEHHH
jgi:hypothetical protein